MDSAHHQWPQGHNEEIKAVEKKPRPEKAQALECPRCKSTNTKFCYYNNYNLSQPRYLCKTCRRYWTQGGSLRNVPVGGGSRKHNKKSSSSSSAAAAAVAASKKIFTPVPNFSPQVHPNDPHQNLNLGFNIPSLVANVPTSSSCDFLAFDQTKNFGNPQNPNSSYHHQHHDQPSSSFSLMELLRGGSFGNPQNPNTVCLPGLPVHADHNMNQMSKPNLSFSLHGASDQSGYGNMLQGFQDHHESSSSRILLPFEELMKQPHVNASHEQAENKEKGQGEFVNGYWNGMVAGGSSW